MKLLTGSSITGVYQDISTVIVGWDSRVEKSMSGGCETEDGLVKIGIYSRIGAIHCK